jgi:leucyl-tRNA synthetase
VSRIKQAASADKIRFAREQRREPTQAEHMLWEALRGASLQPKFRRQHPIGDFVLDFYCDEARLALEIDGPDHALQADYDGWRDEQLGRRGIRVLRIRSEEVEGDLGGVLERIKASLTP